MGFERSEIFCCKIHLVTVGLFECFNIAEISARSSSDQQEAAVLYCGGEVRPELLAMISV